VSRRLPRYPVYVISKGRAEPGLTARFLDRDRVPFRLVVEPTERDEYAARFGAARLHVLPFHDLGQGSIPARNWVWEHARASGAARHWILDDNIVEIYRRLHGERVRCPAGPALALAEDFADRYVNVAILGLNYYSFAFAAELPPFYLNHHVYSCLLLDNALAPRWRGRYNEDTDLCLQVLARGLCTVLLNAVVIDKEGTMTNKGGNTTTLYQHDGRLKMARALERVWPRVVTVGRRFARPQHVVAHAWRRFDTPLIPRPDLIRPVGHDEYGMTLRARRDVADAHLRRLLGEAVPPRALTLAGASGG